MIQLPAPSAVWQSVLLKCGCSPAIVQKWGPVFEHVVKANSFSKGAVELNDFLPTILHESKMLNRMEEDLTYTTPERLMAVWPSRFKTLATAQPYVRNPELLANLVYGGRMGNTAPGDGWRYRGRGPIGLTGKENYARIGDMVGQDLVGIPDLAAQPHFALEFAIAWWEDKIPDSMLGETTAIRQRVNGGKIGVDEVARLTDIVSSAFA